jgi:hypothetical protein
LPATARPALELLKACENLKSCLRNTCNTARPGFEQSRRHIHGGVIHILFDYAIVIGQAQ